MMLIPFITILRPKQWLKNLMVLFPPLLSGGFLPLVIVTRGMAPFLALCCASSATYIINDLLDRQRDANHPVKSKRPIAAGKIAAKEAVLLSSILMLFSAYLCFQVSDAFLLYVAIYLLISVAYSFYLKNIALLDVFCIALGFVLRLYAGGEAFGVVISDWLFLTVFLLAMFLSFGKRFSEILALGELAGSHRRTLELYNPDFLKSALYLSGASVLVVYAIYAINRPLMIYTVPLCMYGLLRYLMRLQQGEDGDPTDSLLKDFPLFMTGLAWISMVIYGVYL